MTLSTHMITQPDVDQLVELLRRLCPNTDFTLQRVNDILRGPLCDLLDPSGKLDVDRLRAALELNKARSPVVKTVSIDYQMTDEEMLKDMTRATTRPTFSLIDTVDACFTWHCNDAEVLEWAARLPRNGSSGKSLDVATLAFARNVGGERVMTEMRYSREKFADFPYLIAFIKKYGRRREMKPIMITHPDFVEAGDAPSEALVYRRKGRAHELFVVRKSDDNAKVIEWSRTLLLAAPGLL